MKVLVLLGTRKGAFILESDAGRRSWAMRGPLCETWPLNHVNADPATGTIYAGGGSEWFGPAVWKSTDLGRTWTHSSEGLAYETGEPPIKSVWSVAPGPAALYAGVEPAGLFRSDDAGQSWRHVAGLRDHPSRPDWQPGGGGLILHSLVPNPADDKSSGWGSPRPACSTPRTAVTAGRRAIGGPAAISCRRGSAIPSTGSACTAS